MGRLTNPTLVLIPHEALGAVLVLFLVLGGICMVVGLRRAATVLVFTAIATPFISVMVEALFNEFFAALPPGLVTPIAYLVLAITYLVVGGMLMGALFGERVWTETKAQLLADAIRGLFRLAFSRVMLVVWVIAAAYLWWSAR
jgi:hypothetical protein